MRLYGLVLMVGTHAEDLVEGLDAALLSLAVAVTSATLAPLEYIALVGGAIAGFLIWDEVPDNWVVMGAMIIIGSGVF